MNPFTTARATSEAVHESVLQWARGLLDRADHKAVEVHGSFPPEDHPQPYAVLFPYRMTLWPKLVESVDAVPFLGQIRNPGSPVAGVPQPWADLAARMGAILHRVIPPAPTKGGRPPRPASWNLLDDLPPPLARWYRAQPDAPDENGVQWRGERDGAAGGVLPTLAWRPPVKVRINYLVQVVAGAGHPAPAAFAIGALSALTLGTHLERTIPVHLPEAPAVPGLETLVDAIAACGTEEEQEALRDNARDVFVARDQLVPLLPTESPSADDFAEIMRSLRRPLHPTLLLQVLIPLGGGPILAPTASPQFDITTPPRGGAPAEGV